MSYEVDYTDIIRAYQLKTTEFMNQIITAEAKLNASAGLIKKLEEKILELETENSKLNSQKTVRQKKSVSKTQTNISEPDNIIDYN